LALRRLSRGSKAFGVCELRAFLRRLLSLVGSNSLGQRVAMDAEHGGRVREMLLMTREGLLNVELLEFTHGLIQKDVTFKHLINQIFETVVDQSSLPVSSL